MDEILDLAERLGKRIAADPRAQRMSEASRSFEADTEAREKLQRFEAEQQRLAQLEQSGQPIEPEDKRALAGLHEAVVSSETIKALLKAQADYLELMTTVSQRIESASLGRSEQQEGQA